MSVKFQSYIIRGKFRKKAIAKPIAIRGHENITSQKVKEAAFQIFENRCNFDESLFLDLYAGSGQMGFEAISRGCPQVGFAEINSRRLKDIRQWVDQNDPEAGAYFFKKDVIRLFGKVLKNPEEVFDKADEIPETLLVYADPPYQENENNFESAVKLLHIFNDIKTPFLQKTLMVQTPLKSSRIEHFLKANPVLSEIPVDFHHYGKHCLIEINS
ncbi:MAG: RsmD family RNA methyltransferase [Leptospirales bacterium]